MMRSFPIPDGYYMLMPEDIIREDDLTWSAANSKFVPVTGLEGFIGERIATRMFPIIRPGAPKMFPTEAPLVIGQPFRDLRNMHERFGFSLKPFGLKALNHRVSFLDEELNEIKEAIVNKDAEGVLDGLIDLIVVAAGTIDLCNADGIQAWKEVMNKNNQKQVGFNPSRPDSDGVDLIKPEGWTPPDLSSFTGSLAAILTEDSISENEMSVGHEFPFAVAEELAEKILDFGIDSGHIDLGHGTSSQTISFQIEGYEYRHGDTVAINSVLYEPKQPQEFGIKKDRAAIGILEGCIELMRRKAQDYTSVNSSVKPVDYYPNGIDDFIYMIDVLKRFRMLSVLDNMKAGGAPNFDSLTDIFQDRIVYLALAMEWIVGSMDGQNPDHDLWNRPKSLGNAQ